MSNPAQTRYHGLDGLRAVMMLLGLVLHAIVSYMDTPASPAWPFRDTSTSPIWTHLLLFIHVFRMPIFFVMAGFFAALLLERRGAESMVRNRTMRILVPFVIGCIILVPLTMTGFVFAISAQSGTLAGGWQAVRELPPLAYLPWSTIHLWFLYYLLMFYAAALGIVAVVRRLPESLRHGSMAFFGHLIQSRWRVPFLTVLTFPVLAIMPLGILKTSTSWIPDPFMFVVYGVFFGFGWLLYGRRDLLYTCNRHAWTYVVLALVLAPVNSFSAQRGILFGPEPVSWLVTAFSGAVIVWLLTFGLTGLFQRYFGRAIPSVRYVVDASYWLYLIHLPFAIWIPGLMSHMAWPSGVKIVVLLLVSTPIWLLSYDLLVRGTLIGVMLNGRRYPRGLPAPVPA